LALTTVALMRLRAACACAVVRTEADLACARWPARTDADLAPACEGVGTAAAEDVGSEALVAEVDWVEPHPASVITAADSASSVKHQPNRNRLGRV
jgi:hypothetical protein